MNDRSLFTLHLYSFCFTVLVQLACPLTAGNHAQHVYETLSSLYYSNISTLPNSVRLRCDSFNLRHEFRAGIYVAAKVPSVFY